ncbi:hypothetical protein CTI12_AA560870 [Artemisia annua]|uniref:Helitron helicase-like domain-containing protein n=1 Tax=Artemisia annua TaxID=35608 RepID=A0A2U1KUF6_ARTAN|nr:hypothetical protein CTI12_AA560870 [Artemisia annua]
MWLDLCQVLLPISTDCLLKTIPFRKKKTSYCLSNTTNAHASPQCKIHGPDVVNVIASDSCGHQFSDPSNNDDVYVHQQSLHHASQVQCPPTPVHVPSGQHYNPTAFSQSMFTNAGIKNGDPLVQPSGCISDLTFYIGIGSSDHGGQCLHRQRKRGRPRKDKGAAEPIEVGSSTCSVACLQHPRKRTRPQKEMVDRETANCDLAAGMPPRCGSSKHQQDSAYPTGNSVGSNVQSHNSHGQPQTENQQLSLHRCKGTSANELQRLMCIPLANQKQLKQVQFTYFLALGVRHVFDLHLYLYLLSHSLFADTAFVRAGALPDAPQTADSTNQRSRMTRRRHVLMQQSQSLLHTHVNTVEEGSSSYTPQETRKRSGNLRQSSSRCIRQRTSGAHVHTTGQPEAAGTGAIHILSCFRCPTHVSSAAISLTSVPFGFCTCHVCVRTGAMPDAPQTAGSINRRSRMTRRRRVLMQQSQSPLHSHVNIVEEGSSSYTPEGASPAYHDLGDCTERCRYCGASFWFGERLMSNALRCGPPQYRLCCGGGRVLMEPEVDPPEYIKQLLADNFNGPELDPEIVQGLIHFLDEHNELVQLLRTARDKCADHDVPEFRVRLYSGERPRGYELPASQTLGAIVFDSGPESESNYDVILEYRDGVIKRVSKLHKSYMSLQFPLIFIYGQPGYHTKLMLRTGDPSDEPKRVSMNAYYTYQEKAIVCPKNETADTINSQVLSMVHGEVTTYASYDVATPIANSEALPAPLPLTDKDNTEDEKEQEDEPHTTLLSPLTETTKEMELPEHDLQQANDLLIGNEATSAIPGTPMEFIQQETSPPPMKEKTAQESKGKTVKRPLFKQQPEESKKQKGTHCIFN